MRTLKKLFGWGTSKRTEDERETADGLAIARSLPQLAPETRPSDAASTTAKLEQSIKSIVKDKQLRGLDSLLSELRRLPNRADILRRMVDLLARMGRNAASDEVLAEMLAVAPGAISGRLVSAVLSAGDSPKLLSHLVEHATAGKLSAEAVSAVIRGLEDRAQIDRAVEVARLSIERDPSNIDLYLALADLLRRMNDSDGARIQLEAASAIAPTDDRVLRELGRLEVFEENYATGEAYLRKAINANPKNVRPYVDLGRCLLQQKRFDEAADFLREAASLFPTRSEIPGYLGTVLRWCGKHDEAISALSRAIELKPDNAMALTELALIYEEVRDFEPALDLHRRAGEIRGGSYNATMFCHSLLGAGRGREGWAANMKRIESAALRTLPGIRVWDGESLDGKSIVVINEGGTGDQIRDACVYPDIIAAAKRATITCEPRLRSLFMRSFPEAHFLPVKAEQRIAEYERMLSKIIDEHAMAAMKQHDYCVLSPDLLYFFRGDDHLWNRAKSYLVPASELLDRWRGRVAALGPGLKVGISWRSGALYYNRECFYTRLIDWGPILRLPGVHFVNVQYDESEQEVRAAEEAFGLRIHRWDDLNLKDDFDGVSALIKQLDLVLAPNTTVLELAGALGVTGWYMIRVPIAYDHWRRKDDSGQDRLYPSVKQVRGAEPWDTASLVTNVAAGIGKLIEERAKRLSAL